MLAAWLAAFVFAFAAFGAGANGVGSIIGGSAVPRRYLLKVGYQATIIDAYLSALMLIAGLAAAVYSTSAVLRLRTEETGNLAEPVLGAATGRIRWALGHISVAVGGACLLLTAAGLSAGLGYGILTGSVSTQLPKLLGAAAARLPATMVLPAVFGPPLQWPAWMMDISPFTQIPKLPGGTVSAEPLIWLCAVVLAISTAGLAGLRRRDFGDLGPSRPGDAIRDRIVAYASFDPSQQAGRPGSAQPPEVTDRGAGPLPPGRQPQGDQAGPELDDVSPYSKRQAPK